MTTFTSALDPWGIPAGLREFPPTHDAALARLDQAQPGPYARTRNALDGAVTGLSPYLTHGLVTLPQAARHIAGRHALSPADKLAAEFGWREFFQHVGLHAGDAILKDMRPTLPWPGRYASEVPADVREGRTGVGAIDAAVRVLYDTGYLHNHARMWLASYLVHLRKTSWRAGADWLWAHLLDGDLASNHLSWQWIAGSFSSKPYLFNAENVAKFAPASARAAWDCRGSVLDDSYEALEAIARQAADTGPQPGTHAAVPEPTRLAEPPDALLAGLRLLEPGNGATPWQGRPLELVHPWGLRRTGPADAFHLGVIHLPAHAAWPWSERRWHFVVSAMAGCCDAVWIGDVRHLAGAAGARVQACAFPGYREALRALGVQLRPQPRLFPWPPGPSRSFSQFWQVASKAPAANRQWPGEGQYADG